MIETLKKILEHNFTSIKKEVLGLFSLTACIAFLYAVFTRQVVLGAEIFAGFLGTVLGYYYGYKSGQKNVENNKETDN